MMIESAYFALVLRLVISLANAVSLVKIIKCIREMVPVRPTRNYAHYDAPSKPARLTLTYPTCKCRKSLVRCRESQPID